MSSSARIALLLLAGIALGGGGRVLLSTLRGGGEVPRPGEPPAREAPREPPPLAESAEGPPPAATTPSGASPAAELAALLDSIPPPQASDGLVIEGSVRGEGDEPVPGVVIRIAPFGLPPGHDDTSANIQARDIEKYIIDRTAEHRFRHGGAREARSDERGRFRFEDLAAARYTVSAPVEGVRIEVRVGSSVRRWVTPGEEVEIRAIRTVSIPVAVRFPDGTSPATAQVHFSGDRQNAAVPWRPEAPALSVPAGSYQVLAVVEGWDSPSVPATARPGGSETVVLELTRMSGIELSVELPAGEIVVGALSIRYLALAPGEEPTTERLLRNGIQDGIWGHQGEGISFARRIFPLPPARYALGIGRTDDALDVLTTATVGEGLAAVAVALPPLADEDAIEVRAFDPDGRPIAVYSASLQLEREPGDMDSVEHAAVRREDGSQLLIPSLGSRQSIRDDGGELWVEARTQGYARALARVVGGSAVVRFVPSATVIVDAPGFEEDSSDAQLHFIDGEGLLALSESLEGAVTTLGTVGAGEYLVELEVSGDQPIEPFRVFLAPGENRIPIEIPPSFTLEIEIAEGQEAAEWTIERIDGRLGRDSGFGERGSKIVEGVVRFEGLFPGHYAVLAMDENMSVEVQRIAVTGDLRMRFAGAPLDAILIRMREDVRLEGTDLRDGDLIIGVNGREFANSQDLMSALILLSESPEGTLLIERAGAGRVTVEAPAEGLESLFDGGGILPVPVARQK